MKWWLDQVSKNYAPKQSEPFTPEEIVSFIDSLEPNKNVDPKKIAEKLQTQTAVIVAFSGGLHEKEDHELRWKDVEFSNHPQGPTFHVTDEQFMATMNSAGRTLILATIRKKIIFKLLKTKGNPQGRTFHVTDERFMTMINKYKASMEETAKVGTKSWFYLNWSDERHGWRVIHKGKSFSEGFG